MGKGAVGRERRTKLSGGAVGERKELSDGREGVVEKEELSEELMDVKRSCVKGAVGIGSCREGAVGRELSEGSCREGGQLP